MTLPRGLQAAREAIEAYARDCGLDFYHTIFEMLEYDELNEVACYGGFPTRYPHWRFGMEYEEMSKGYSYGLQKIYEMVINNDPCYAYLMKCNSFVDQKLVIAHVFAHCDFFKNNLWFANTHRKMIDEMANHGSRLRGHMERYGLEEVERFLDSCLSLENLIDRHSLFIRRVSLAGLPDASDAAGPARAPRLKSKDYLERFMNPRETGAQAAAREEKEKKDAADQARFPPSEVKDVLLFLLEHAPLNRWQRDILSLVREEAYYFAPQGMTKIMNEGWASYWHSFIMTRKILSDPEVVDYADHHSGTLGTRPGVINPYKLGIELFRDIEERWNTGRFGKEYEECEDRETRRRWHKHLDQGRKKIFEVRTIYNDVSFIDHFLTEEFCEEHGLFTYATNPHTGEKEIASRDFPAIKQQLLFQLTNFGQPHLAVYDGNYRNRGELYLLHRHEGIDLQLDHAHDTLKNLYRIWTRPVHVETVLEEKPILLSYDGEESKQVQL